VVAGVLPRLGPTYRVLGHGDLVTGLARGLAGWRASAPFGWMNTMADGKPGEHAPAGGGERPQQARWLGAGDMPAVSGLLNRAFPDSYAWPGMAGVRRWAGIDGPDGGLAAVAADAWSAPTVGFMAGVAVSEEARGRGLGGRLCGFVIADLMARHGRAALMVDGWNNAAIRLYQRLGLVFRPVRAGWADPVRG
jgi:GNAT superfamily N-acetyltransferase